MVDDPEHRDLRGREEGASKQSNKHKGYSTAVFSCQELMYTGLCAAYAVKNTLISSICSFSERSFIGVTGLGSRLGKKKG